MVKFTYLNFDISLSKSTDVVCLRFLDRDTFNVYQIIFNKVFVIKNGLGNVNNIYTILIESLDKLDKPPNTILITHDAIEIYIEYDKNGFLFNLTCKLDQISSSDVDGKDLYIKKLEQQIEELKQDQICVIYWNPNATYVIPKKITKIVFDKSSSYFNYDKLSKCLRININDYYSRLKGCQASEIEADSVEVPHDERNTFFSRCPWFEGHENIKFI